MFVRASIVVSGFAVFAACASNSTKPAQTLDGLDTFGSSRISATEIKNQYGQQIDAWVSMPIAENYFRIQEQIEKSIQEKYHFAYVHLSLVTYFDPKPGKYLTVDVVEPADVPARMNFNPTPTEKFPDPDGLIALWTQYEQIAHDLQVSGKFAYPKQCPVWHCAWGFENPVLAPFQEKFRRLVPKDQNQLIEVLNKDSRPSYRANAAFLLAHIPDGKKLVSELMNVVKDPSPLVRNNAVRVLSEIADKHSEISIPVEPILQVLNFPATTDRNKAGAVLLGLSKKIEDQRAILKEGGLILLQMLKLQQPNNHDFAYLTLQNLCSAHFDERDYPSWEKCITK